MYVAITRAKKELILSHAKSRYVFGDVQMQIPSRFLKELPEAEIEFEDLSFVQNQGFNSVYQSGNSFKSRNDFKNSFFESDYKNSAKPSQSSQNSDNQNSIFNKRVFHQKFGYGKVLSADGNKLEISFEKTGIKTVMKDFITLA